MKISDNTISLFILNINQSHAKADILTIRIITAKYAALIYLLYAITAVQYVLLMALRYVCVCPSLSQITFHSRANH